MDSYFSSNCPSQECLDGPKAGRLVLNGCFFRKSQSKYIQRYRCNRCGRSVSRATLNSCFGQNKRNINSLVFKLLCSGVSQRRSALILGVNRKTIERKIKFLALQKKLEHMEFLEKNYSSHPCSTIQFDEMETHEHSKWKPLSIALVVTDQRKILGFNISQMPARGVDAKKSVKKYGYRRDYRSAGLSELLLSLKSVIRDSVHVTTDQKLIYPKILKRYYPQSTHIQVKGQRGSVVGQGELKKIGFDPLFALNHTAAMIRANVNRLFRRTWCTTKTRAGLENHLWLYLSMHNQILTKA